MISKELLNNTIAALSKLYPKAFSVNPRQRKPLKKGLQEELAEAVLNDPAVTNKDYALKLVNLALCQYCGHILYHRTSMRPGTKRIDLKGEAAGFVTYQEALHHAKRFCELTGQTFDPRLVRRKKTKRSKSGVRQKSQQNKTRVVR